MRDSLLVEVEKMFFGIILPLTQMRSELYWLEEFRPQVQSSLMRKGP